MDVGLVDVVDRWYSARGTEMKVYSPTDRSLVLYAGTPPDTKRFREVLSQIVGAIATLSVVSAVVDYLIRTLAPSRDTEAAGGGGRVPPDPDPGIVGIAGMDVTVGVVFFVGGLFVLTLGVLWWYRWR